MNGESTSTSQSQMTNEFQLLEKILEELNVISKALNQRLGAITKEEREKIKNIREKIDEIDYLGDLKKERIEV